MEGSLLEPEPAAARRGTRPGRRRSSAAPRLQLLRLQRPLALRRGREVALPLPFRERARAQSEEADEEVYVLHDDARAMVGGDFLLRE